ncbi:MAG: MBL fold metallo-hydrolase [Saprospiraceae bacterium]|nr:MBL fold metallo-hydrolase [Saprospiraceae bacterium]
MKKETLGIIAICLLCFVACQTTQNTVQKVPTVATAKPSLPQVPTTTTVQPTQPQAPTGEPKFTGPPRQEKKPVTAEQQKHIELAFAAAGQDFISTAILQCDVASVDSKIYGSGPGPNFTDVKVEPTKVFDNLYFVGVGAVGAWAITTNEGIILIDALNNNKEAEEAIEGGFAKFGLDPKTIKYLVITHGHGDHYGGAKYLKDKYGCKIVMSTIDWDYMDKPMRMGPMGARFGPRPERDMEVKDGDKLTLGNTTLNLVLTPGHTPGTLSIILPVKDNGVAHTAGLWGGTAIPKDEAGIKQYIASVDYFMKASAAAKVDVEISNHCFIDNSLKRMETLRARKAGEPNLFVIGEKNYARYMTVFKESTLAALAAVVKD